MDADDGAGSALRDTGAAVPAAEKAYRLLEHLIVTLELPPGSLTTEGALNGRLGLGRTPVREAIQRLAWEGLLTVRPRAGLEIAPLEPADWLRVVDAREGVEIVLARSAARYLDDAAACALSDSAAAMASAVTGGAVSAFLAADKALDEAMAAASQNRFAARLAAPLQTHSRRFWYRFRRQEGLAEAAAHHRELIGAILSRDENAAGREAGRLMALLRAHARSVAE